MDRYRVTLSALVHAHSDVDAERRIGKLFADHKYWYIIKTEKAHVQTEE